MAAQSCTALRTTSATFSWPSDRFWDTAAHAFLRGPSSVTTGNRQTSFGYDTNKINVTTVALTDTALTSSLTQTNQYLSNGNLSSQTVGGVRTLTCYDSVNSLYPVLRLSGADSAATCPTPTGATEARKTTYAFDSNTGLLSTQTDSNNSITTTFQYDNLGRTKQTTETGTSLTRSVTTVYDDLNLTETVTRSDTKNGSATTLTSKTGFDALGRVSYLQDAAGSMVQKAYRYGTTTQNATFEIASNPHIADTETTMGWQVTARDAVGRITSAESFSGKTVPAPWGTNASSTGKLTFAYDVTGTSCTGRVGQSTDAAALTTTNCFDVLGRLTSVTEPDGRVTVHTYDTLDNPTKVTGPTGTRAFAFDALGRLRTACNPESATADCTQSSIPQTGDDRYSYDGNGNLTSRTDARGIVATVAGFDALNRPGSITYSDGTPTVTYGYDQGFKGALSSSSVVRGGLVYGVSYTFDGLGRTTGSTQVTAGNTYNFSYQYSLADRLEQMTYPSGRVVKYGSDTAGRVSDAKNGSTGSSYASLSYNGLGQVSSLALGNGLTETYSWNDRSQFVKLAAGTQLTLNLYPCASSTTTCTSGNNGLMRSQEIVAPGLDVTQTYGYDGGSRLTSVAEGTMFSESYQYTNTAGQLTGNRWVSARTGQLPVLTSQTPQSASWFGTNNRISGWTYDEAGNITAVGGTARTFAYDGENRITAAVVNGISATYVYDGDGRRVQKIVGSVTTTYVYDAMGNLAAEFGLGAGQQTGACAAGTCYVTVDHLGSTRMVTDASGNVAARYDYLPFGQEVLAGTGGRTAAQGYGAAPDGFSLKFTGQVRDGETGLDYLNARYYDPAQGRFQSMDPGNAGGDLASPQTWNGFAYVNNSPMNYIDPSGQFLATTAGSGGGPIGTIVGGLIDLGLLFGDLFGGSGGSPPKPDWSTTVWGTSQTQTTQVSGAGSAADAGIYVLPGILASVTGTAKAPIKSEACEAGTNGASIVTGTYTLPLTGVGAAMGSLVGPGGTLPGALVGSMFGAGVTGSYVSATKSIYIGGTVTFGLGISGGGGASINAVNVPRGQNANAIANGQSYSLTYQPLKYAGSTVTKSPGSGPPVVGPSIGTRIPFAASYAFNFCLRNCGC